MLKHSTFVFLLAAVSLFSRPAPAQTLTWDSDLSTAGSQNGSGTWSLTNQNWFDGTNNVLWPADQSTTAIFGGGAAGAASTVAVSGTVGAAGLLFQTLTSAGTLVGANVYTFTGGTINLASNAQILLADNSSTGSAFVTISSAVNAANLTIAKSGGTAIQYFTLGGSAGSLTGTFTIKSNNGGIFARASSPFALNTLDRIVVENGSTFDANFSGTVSFAVPFSLAGFGGTNDYGAIRVDQSNTNFTGPITLTEAAGIRTNIDIQNTTISGGIGEAVAGAAFTRVATTGSSTLTISSAGTYTGATNLGRGTANQGGITTLDFAVSGLSTNLLYHDVAAGALNLVGGSSSTTALVLRGADSGTQSQSFSALNVSGTRSSITLNSGSAGTINLALGPITRTATTTLPALLSVTLPASGKVTTTSPDGFLGAWATVASPSAGSSWAAVKNGRLTNFTGDLAAITGNSLASLSATPGSTHFRIDATSTGAISPGAATTTDLATVSFTDKTTARVLDVGAGKILRLGLVGGVQLTPLSADVAIGDPSAPGTITAGGATNVAGALLLTNFSGNLLTVNSAIANNGTGAVSLVVNGSGRVLLPAANTYTGLTTVASGALEVSNANALGSTAVSTLVMSGAALRLSGDLTLNEPLVIAGAGVANDGALRLVSGNTTINSLISQSQVSRINADANSTLTIVRTTSPTITDGINGANALTLGGAGNIIVGSRITIASSALTKDGSGIVTLRGTNVFTGATTIAGGTLLLDFPNATTATNILYNGVVGALTMSGGTLRLLGIPNAATTQTFGAITLALGNSGFDLATNGSPSLTLTPTTLTRAIGAVANFNLPAGATMTTTSGTNNAILSTSAAVYATVNGNDWAATDATAINRKIVGLSTITGGYSSSTATTVTASTNVDAIAPSTVIPASGTTTLTSLRFNQAQDTTITQATGAVRTLGIGGILVTPAVGAKTSTISVANLRPGATALNLDLVVIQNNPLGDLLISSAIINNTSANALTKSGPGKLILSGMNTYSGATRVYDGALQIAGGQLAATTDILLGSGATSGRLIIGAVDTGAGITVNSLSAGGFGLANAVVGGSSSMSMLTLNGGTSAFGNGTIGGAGVNEDNVALTLNGGLLQLGRANRYTGETTINAGAVEITALGNAGSASSFGSASSPIQLGSGPGSPGVLVTARYTGVTATSTDRPLLLNNNTSATSITVELDSSGPGAMSFTAPLQSTGINAAPRLLRLTGTSLGANFLAGVLDDPGVVTNVEKSGTGRWALGGSTIQGVVTVKAGTLEVRGALSGTIVNLGDSLLPAGSAILAGLGRVGPVYGAGSGDPDLSGATVAPGADRGLTGLLETAGLSITAGAHLDLEINGSNAGTALAGYDEISSSGTVTLTGADLKLTLATGLTFQDGTALTLIVNNSGGLITGQFATLNGAAFDPFNILLNGRTFELHYDGQFTGPGNDGTANDLVLVAVPEPSAAAAVLLGAALLLARRRRKGMPRSES
jgi:autotransporter-associated beta strand protein